MSTYKNFLTIGLLFMTIVLNGQMYNPIKWEMDKKDLGNGEYELIFAAHIDKGWTVYSQYTSDEGPVPTAITYEQKDGVDLVGKATEKGHRKEGMDKLFGVNVIKFLDDEDFVIRQRIKVKDPSKPLTGYLTFMTCDNKRCLPPTDLDFSFEFSQKTEDVADSENKEDIKVAKNNPSASIPDDIKQNAHEESEKKHSSPVIKMGESNISANKMVKADKSSQPKNLKNVNLKKEESSSQQGGPSKLLNPVKWKITKEKISDSEYLLKFRASIDKGWAVYSQYMEEGGPVPTSITYEHADGVEMVGKAIEKGHKKEGKDKLFPEVDKVIKFLDDEDFEIVQKVKIIDPDKPLSGYLTFMTCNDKSCKSPTDVEFDFGFGKPKPQIEALVGTDGMIDQRRETIRATLHNPLSDCGSEQASQNGSLWLLFIAGLLGGFAALLTPCVFPMIPITVSFFTKDTKRKGWVNGLIYGISIIVIYVVLGLLITILLGPEVLQSLATNWIANVLFFLIFIVFAFSFFGFYEITLPSSWSTKSDSLADKGGLIGIFFMAATLALVSFSCTGPIVGSALVAAADGGFMGPLVVMFGFALALSLPFGLFASFPAWLNSLPKSGGWMNSVKVVLGFLELGFAFKFLSTADLTQHWGILKYETFMGILIAVSLAIAIYLFGFIKFPHDSPINKLSWTRKIIASAFLLLAGYLAMGFTVNKNTGIYNSLWLTSGFSPPVNYNLFLEPAKVDPEIKSKYPSYTLCANNIRCFKDYYEGMAYAKEIGKPAFLDFTGHGCQNCRRTEDNIWVDDRVRKILDEDVVMISLYTDDRKLLEKPFISKVDQKKKRNVGSKWTDFQVANFEQNSQPLYIMMTTDEEVVTHPRGYEVGVDDYLEYLNCGLRYFKK